MEISRTGRPAFETHEGRAIFSDVSIPSVTILSLLKDNRND